MSKRMKKNKIFLSFLLFLFIFSFILRFSSRPTQAQAGFFLLALGTELWAADKALRVAEEAANVMTKKVTDKKRHHYYLEKLKELKTVGVGARSKTIRDQKKFVEREIKNLEVKYKNFTVHSKEWPEEDKKKYKEYRNKKIELETILQTGKSISDDLDEMEKVASKQDPQTFKETINKHNEWLKKVTDKIVKYKDDVAHAKFVYDPNEPKEVKISVPKDSEIYFYVNGVEIPPGIEDKDVKLGRNRKLTIRAYAMGKNRKFCLEKKPVRGAEFVEIKRTPYHFEFTVTKGTYSGRTCWKVKSEEYKWVQPSAIGSAIKKEKEPTFNTFDKKATDDVMEWTVPVVSESRFGEHGSRMFSTSVWTRVEWDYTRVTNKGGRVHDIKDDTCFGYLSIIVHPR